MALLGNVRRINLAISTNPHGYHGSERVKEFTNVLQAVTWPRKVKLQLASLNERLRPAVKAIEELDGLLSPKLVLVRFFAVLEPAGKGAREQSERVAELFAKLIRYTELRELMLRGLDGGAQWVTDCGLPHSIRELHLYWKRQENHTNWRAMLARIIGSSANLYKLAIFIPTSDLVQGSSDGTTIILPVLEHLEIDFDALSFPLFQFLAIFQAPYLRLLTITAPFLPVELAEGNIPEDLCRRYSCLKRIDCIIEGVDTLHRREQEEEDKLVGTYRKEGIGVMIYHQSIS